MSALKILGVILVVAGALIALLAATADVTGIGGGSPGFGPKQLTGLIFGIIVMAVGLAALYLGKRGRAREES